MFYRLNFILWFFIYYVQYSIKIVFYCTIRKIYYNKYFILFLYVHLNFLKNIKFCIVFFYYVCIWLIIYNYQT
jgi:hypothetical protein